jgi:hypothetical protein
MADRDFLQRLKIDGERIDARLDGRVTAATVTRTMDGASSIELVVDDHDLAVLQSGLLLTPSRKERRERGIAAFDQASWARYGEARLTVDSWFTRLAGVHVNLNASQRQVVLTFEDEIATLMRNQTKAYKSRRENAKPNSPGSTRAQFIGQLLDISSEPVGFVRYFSPESSARQPVKEVDEDPARQKGFAANARLPIKGQNADADQRKHLATALAVADRLKAPELAVLAMLVAGTGESTWTNVVNSLGYGGVFQGQVAVSGSPNWFGPMGAFERTQEQAESFLLGGRGFQQDGAIALARANPQMDPGEIATRVEASGKPGSFYEIYRPEAEKILDAWGGVTNRQVVLKRGFEFQAGGKHRGQQHNYWDDAGDLAAEVRWRLFADLNILYFVSDEWLFQRRPVIVIDKGLLSGGVFAINATADVGMPVAEVEVVAKLPDWKAPPGATVELVDLGPLDGRWLLWESVDDRLTDQVTLTLRRPAPKKKEPAPKIKSREHGAGEVNSNAVETGNRLVYPLSIKGRNLGGVAAHMARAWGNWQSDRAVDIGVPRGTKVYAVDDGTIVNLGGSWNGGAGNPDGWNITIRTKWNQWFYTHLMSRVPLRIGQRVKAGEYLGRSGAANGVNHLHIACEHGDPEEKLGL